QGVGKVFDFAGAQALDVVDCGVLQHLGGRAGHLLAGGQGQGGDDVKADFKRQVPLLFEYR
ncbi:hypothetical protein, partial [Xylella fastidiosa]|uniref:hypothetical protein n=1 Tax=Xylella fastidiosa TaxID=2371 RepID=UPI001CA3BB43